jgi:hypothetical protein
VLNRLVPLTRSTRFERTEQVSGLDSVVAYVRRSSILTSRKTGDMGHTSGAKTKSLTRTSGTFVLAQLLIQRCVWRRVILG